MVSIKKSKVKERQHTYNDVSAILEKDPDDAAQLTDCEIETAILAVEHEAMSLVGNRSGRQYLKDFENANLAPLSYQRRLTRDQPSSLLTKESKKNLGTTMLYARIPLKKQVHCFSLMFSLSYQTYQQE